MPSLNRITRLLTVSFVLLTASTPLLAERRERLIDEWRPIHYEISITLDDKLSQIVSAHADISAQIVRSTISSISMDFGELPIDSVSVDGTPAKFVQSSGKLIVTLTKSVKKGDELRISVDYHGHPKDGLIFAPDKDGTASVVGDNWPDRVHHWIPTLDHPSAKASVRFTVTAPALQLVLANGRLESISNAPNNTRTWIWNETVPISPYCMIIAVGDFARFEASDQNVTPLSIYVPKSDSQFAMQGFAPASPSLKFFSETVGTYPYEKLALVVGATRFGGMENSSAIVFNSELFNDFRSRKPRSRLYDMPSGTRNVVAHEIAHQWFGDSVTEATWADLWLSEGFATYFCGLFIEKYEGESDFRAFMKDDANEYLTYEKKTKTPLHDTDTENLNALLNPNNYQKGSWVLHMLRGVIGDKAFFNSIREYYSSHRDATATSEDLRASMEKASGMNLKWFFTEWVYGTGHPRYEVAWKFAAAGNSKLNGFVELNVRQVQDGEAFLNPLTVEIIASDGPKRVTLTPKGKETAMRIPVPHRPASISIDPDQVVLKEITYLRND